MQELTKKAITGLIWLQSIMAVMLFVPAGTLHFWDAWAFWLLFSVLSTVVTFYFLKHDSRSCRETAQSRGRPPNTRRAQSEPKAGGVAGSSTHRPNTLDVGRCRIVRWK